MARYKTPLCQGRAATGAPCRNRTTNPDGWCGRCSGGAEDTPPPAAASVAAPADPFVTVRPWDGRVVLLTGVIPGFRSADREQIVASLGGIQAQRPSAAVHVVVAGENAGPAKLRKFEQLGVPVMSLSDFTAVAATSDWAEVRFWAAKHPGATEEALALLANDPNEAIRSWARGHANYVEAKGDAAVAGLLAD